MYFSKRILPKPFYFLRQIYDQIGRHFLINLFRKKDLNFFFVIFTSLMFG